jgi:hypothetical protein
VHDDHAPDMSAHEGHMKRRREALESRETDRDDGMARVQRGQT